MMNANQPPMAPVCCLCQTGFTEPKVLPCLHTFCLNCLKKLVTDSVLPEIMCPTCGCQVTLPPSGVSGLTTNYIVKRLADRYFEELKHTLYGEQAGAETDEGFGEHATGQMTRSETWHGSQIGTSSSGMVPSKSVEGTTSLYSLSVSATTDQGEEGKQPAESAEATREDLEKKKDACRVTGKLMSKLLHLQGEALRLTYSIDAVNESVEQWGVRNNEIKSQIMDRSLILQHIIKKQEQKMLAEVDKLESHEKFNSEVDRTKTELRGNLKRVLNGIEFLKHVQHYADEDDVLKMKEFLLGDLKILSNVEMNQREYEFSFSPSEESLAEYFGSLVAVEKTSFVFEPESTKPEQNFGDMKLTQVEKVKQMEFTRASSRDRLSRRQRAKTQQIYYPAAASKEVRFASPQRQTRRVSDAQDTSPLGETKPEVRVDIRDLQETLKQRRRELLQEKQAENSLQLLAVRRRPPREKKRRVQSFGGSGSSRTRLMEQAAMAFRVPGETHHVEKQRNLAKTDSMESVDEETISEDVSEEKPQAHDDISTKLKYLRGTWQKRREILRSSESLGDDASPNSPKSPNSDGKTEGENHFSALKDTYNSIKEQFTATRDVQTPPITMKLETVRNDSERNKKSYGTLVNSTCDQQVPPSASSSSYQFSTSRSIQSGGTVTTNSEAPVPRSSYQSIYSQRANAVTTTESTGYRNTPSVTTGVAPTEITRTVEITGNNSGGTVTKTSEAPVPRSSYETIYYQRANVVTTTESTDYRKTPSITTSVAPTDITTTVEITGNKPISSYQSSRYYSQGSPQESSSSTSTYGRTLNDNTNSATTFQSTVAKPDKFGSYSSSNLDTRITRESSAVKPSSSLYSRETSKPATSSSSTYTHHDGTGKSQVTRSSGTSSAAPAEDEPSLEDRMNQLRENARKRVEKLMSQN